MHSPVTGASAKHSATYACQLASGIGVTDGDGGFGRGGGGEGEGGGLGDGVRKHELAGPVLALVQVNLL